MAAVCSFLFTAILVSSLLSHTGFLQRNGSIDLDLNGVRDSVIMIILAVLIFAANTFVHYYQNSKEIIPLPPRYDECGVGFVVGIIFSTGLVISGMVKRNKVINFLDLS